MPCAYFDTAQGGHIPFARWHAMEPLDAGHPPLPVELWELVFSRVPWRERGALRAVCRTWRGVLDAPAAWRDAAERQAVEGGRTAFYNSCRAGQLAAAQWLSGPGGDAGLRFGVISRQMAADSLTAACRGAHLEVAAWLVARFGLVAEARASLLDRGGTLLRWVCRSGTGDRLATVQWLVTTFGTGLEASNVSMSRALASAAFRGDLHLVRWLARDAATYLKGLHPPAVRPNWALRAACTAGHLGVAVWLADWGAFRWGVQMINNSAEGSNGSAASLLAYVCENGHLGVARWIVGRWPIFGGASARGASVRGGLACDAPAAGASAWLARLFPQVCGNGHLRVAQWLVAEFGAPARGLPAALQSACWHGHLVIAQWLVAAFGLGPADAAARDGASEYVDAGGIPISVFVRACRGGHLPTAVWLVDGLGLACDALHVQWAFHAACGRGRLLVAQWLASRWQVVPADAGVGVRHAALWAACAHGHLEVARWLAASGFGPTASALAGHAFEAGEHPLELACAESELEGAAWLADHFGLTAATAPVAAALGAACEVGEFEVARWLVARFGPDAAGTAGAYEVLALACRLAILPDFAEVRWAAGSFNYTAEGLRQHGVLDAAASADGPAVLAWLAGRYGLAPAEVAAARAAAAEASAAVVAELTFSSPEPDA